jgi:hypothetical protein
MNTPLVECYALHTKFLTGSLAHVSVITPNLSVPATGTKPGIAVALLGKPSPGSVGGYYIAIAIQNGNLCGQ